MVIAMVMGVIVRVHIQSCSDGKIKLNKSHPANTTLITFRFQTNGKNPAILQIFIGFF